MTTEINNRTAIVSPTSPLRPSPAVSKVNAEVQGQLPSTIKSGEPVVEDQPVASVDEGRVAKAVDELNSHAEMDAHKLSFSVHESSGRMLIKVVDRKTDQVIYEIPPEKAIEIAEILQQTNDFKSTGLAEQA